VAGYVGRQILGSPTLRELHRASRGVPRLVNILMHKAMLLAYGENRRLIEKRHMRAAVADTPAATRPRRWWWPVLRPAS